MSGTDFDSDGSVDRLGRKVQEAISEQEEGSLVTCWIAAVEVVNVSTGEPELHTYGSIDGTVWQKQGMAHWLVGKFSPLRMPGMEVDGDDAT